MEGVALGSSLKPPNFAPAMSSFTHGRSDELVLLVGKRMCSGWPFPLRGSAVADQYGASTRIARPGIRPDLGS
jgi:hypothetical protein